MPEKKFSSSTCASRTNTRSSTLARLSSPSATCPTASTSSTPTAKSSSTARAADAASAQPSSCKRAVSKTSSTSQAASPPGQPTSIQNCPNTNLGYRTSIRIQRRGPGAPFCLRKLLPEQHPDAYTPVVPDGAFLLITNHRPADRP